MRKRCLTTWQKEQKRERICGFLEVLDFIVPLILVISVGLMGIIAIATSLFCEHDAISISRVSAGNKISNKISTYTDFSSSIENMQSFSGPNADETYYIVNTEQITSLLRWDNKANNWVTCDFSKLGSDEYKLDYPDNGSEGVTYKFKGVDEKDYYFTIKMD